ncbi:MAG: hypothetical protein HKN04_15350 [Rhodothermaceae bacterium]|nr:hypothetical protein [Rhodothermaceae bacterium]
MRSLWTLRLLACAGLVALLSRLPAFASVAEVFVVTATGTALVWSVLHGPRILALIEDELAFLTHPAPGADA